MNVLSLFCWCLTPSVSENVFAFCSSNLLCIVYSKWLLRCLPGLICSENQCNKFSVAMKIHFDKLTLFKEPVTFSSCRDKRKDLMPSAVINGAVISP